MTDHYIGLILRRLEKHDLRRNTIVIFMSDNGHSEEMDLRIRVDDHASGFPKGHPYGASGAGNTGKWIGHKGTFLEGGIRVPAIISHPARLPQGEVRDQIVTAMDWYPTVMELCGIQLAGTQPKLDGFSLLPVIASPAAESGYRGVLHFVWRDQWAVRDGEWKLIGDSKGDPANPKLSLRRLSDDKPEVEDHADDEPEVVARLKRMHDAWISSVTLQDPGSDTPSDP